MKIVYIYEHFGEKADGVYQKIDKQIACWQRDGHSVKLINSAQGKGKGKLGKLTAMFKLTSGDKDMVTELEQFKPDLIYLRYTRYRHLWRHLSNVFHHLVVEVNTLDTKELAGYVEAGVVSKFAYGHALVGRKLLLRMASACVFVTRELMEHKDFAMVKGRKRVIPNSIDIPTDVDISLASGGGSEEKINFAFMATGVDVSWHGLDEIESFAKLVIDEAVVHVIGMEKPDHATPANIVYYGRMEENEFAPILQKCDVALGTAALYRKEMKEACPLKVRTYARYGLPMVLPYKETALMESKPDDNWWFLQFESTPNVLVANRDEIMDFAKKVQGRRLCSDTAAAVFGERVWEATRVEFFKEITEL